MADGEEKFELKWTITIISLCTEFSDKSSRRELSAYQQNMEVNVTPSNLLQPPTTSANTLQDGCLHRFPLREILTDDFNFQLSILLLILHVSINTRYPCAGPAMIRRCPRMDLAIWGWGAAIFHDSVLKGSRCVRPRLGFQHDRCY